MAAFIYPFFKDATGNYNTRPVLPINIINPATNSSQKVYALVDTGADACVFPKNVADGCGHDLKGPAAVHSVTQGIGATTVEIWSHPFHLELLAPDKKQVVWRLKNAVIGCVDHDQAPPLLGWQYFLEKIRITFNYPTKRIIVEI